MKTHDDEHTFRGYWDGALARLCRVRILREADKPQVLIIPELPSNQSTSVANVIGHLVPELIAKHFPHRFDVIGEPPAIIVEHHEPNSSWRMSIRQSRARPTYDLVPFENWRPRVAWQAHGQGQVTLATPTRRQLDADELHSLLGDEVNDS